MILDGLARNDLNRSVAEQRRDHPPVAMVKDRVSASLLLVSASSSVAVMVTRTVSAATGVPQMVRMAEHASLPMLSKVRPVGRSDAVYAIAPFPPVAAGIWNAGIAVLRLVKLRSVTALSPKDGALFTLAAEPRMTTVADDGGPMVYAVLPDAEETPVNVKVMASSRKSPSLTILNDKAV